MTKPNKSPKPCAHIFETAKYITKNVAILWCPKCRATCIATIRED